MINYYIGIDIGGSHISIGLVDSHTGKIKDDKVYRYPLAPGLSAYQILSFWQSCIEKVIHEVGEENVLGIGVAIPGPFDYTRGISEIEGVKKYESLLGVNVKQSIRQIFPDINKPVIFMNDAAAFALGESSAGALKDSNRSIFISLGTGLGSAFLIDGKHVISGDGIPQKGYFYYYPVKDGIADDYFSTRWFESEWRKKNNTPINGVKQLAGKARSNDPDALGVFREFSIELADFMSIWFRSFQPDSMAIGGNISKAYDIFLPDFLQRIKENSCGNIDIRIAELGERAPLVGAAMSVKMQNNTNMETTKRKTTQYLMPGKAPEKPANGKYNIYPGFPIGEGKIKEGSEELAAWMIRHKIVMVDGYVGVFWDDFVADIDAEIKKAGKKALWLHTDAAMHEAPLLEKMIEPYLGNGDPLFGYITDKKLIDWFDKNKMDKIKPDEEYDINILVGCGASLFGWSAPLIYVDIPKNEIQYRMRAGYAANLGMKETKENKQTYKQFYFVDWRVLNEHKKDILPHIDLIVDGQHPENYTFMQGDDLRTGLSSMAHNYFRVRPWFEPGVWGGTWMREHFEGINKDVDNLAWSFELMVLENGILFESGGSLLEVSFDFIMYNNNKEVLGDCAGKFAYDFPIRFDFLDTFDGGNLSIQCHPSNEYIKQKFGMPFTQDETYYVMDCKKEAVVYLGFQEGVDPDEFHTALIRSHEKSVDAGIERYVQKHTANKHDLYLIPNGTIHASGKDILVLEISSAPYIFTFKMYDWLRLDLDGKPRPINIEHGMNNLRFDRQGEKVKEELISKPYIIQEDETFQLEHLPTHKEHFYDVHRYRFDDEIRIDNDNKCHVWMLVEGTSVKLRTSRGMESSFNYAETFVVPAATESYTLINTGKEKAVMVKAFVK